VNSFRLPDVGEGLTEAEIIDWRVKPGDSVALNDILVEVETAKAAVELPSPYAGTVVELLAAPGETVPVGTPIITIAGAGAEESPAAAPEPTPSGTDRTPSATEPTPSATEPTPEAAPAREPVLVGYGPTHGPVGRRPRRAKAPAPGRPVAVTARPVAATARPVAAPAGVHPPATPPVRKLARELGVDLRDITPTGAFGRVTREDVRRVAEQGAALTSGAPNTATNETAPSEVRTPVRGVRKHTAEAMVASAFTAPHVTEWVSVDVTRTLKLMRRLRAEREFADVRLTPLCFVARAALLAIARHPEINAKWDADEIVQFRDVNLGIAAATPRGLIVPNIPAAQSLSLRELAGALSGLVEEARAGKTPPNRMRGGTVTITNIGVFGVDGGTPILNPGEAAILCFGQIRRQPWEHHGRVRLREVTTLALSFDHRLVDGELGSKVLRDIARVLERPDLALAL
jgi:pyruvate dehydrogenase E2 component (dihydrolipoamide acetyltransferase)